MDFGAYELNPEIYDEMLLPDGTPRKHCQLLKQMLDELPGDEARAVQERVTSSFKEEGIVFTVYEEKEALERIIPVDCIPRLIAAAEWNEISIGLEQRIRAINLFLDDLYSDARVLADGVIPEDVILQCPQFRPALRGFRPRRGVWVAVCGTDLVRTNEGFLVLEDNLRVPSGVSYMVSNRIATKSSFRRLYRACKVEEVEHYGQVLAQTLRELAPENVVDPEIVVLTPGVYNSAFYEHMYLAREMAASLVEGQDLFVKDDIVYMQNVSGPRRVDVIYRRIDDDFVDPDAFRDDSVLGVRGLIEAARKGNVALVNAPGTGVADDKSVYPHIPDIIRYYLAEEPLLASVKTWCCRNPEDLERDARQPRGVGGQEGRWLRRLRDACRTGIVPQGKGRIRRANKVKSFRLHCPAYTAFFPRTLPCRRCAGTSPCGPAPVCPDRETNANRPGGILPGGASTRQSRCQFQPGWRGQGSLGSELLNAGTERSRPLLDGTLRGKGGLCLQAAAIPGLFTD